jgi:hypothetical protein
MTNVSFPPIDPFGENTPVSESQPFENATQTNVLALIEVKEGVYEKIESLLKSQALFVKKGQRFGDMGTLGIELELISHMPQKDNAILEDPDWEPDEDDVTIAILKPGIKFRKLITGITDDGRLLTEQAVEQDVLEPYTIRFVAASRSGGMMVVGTTAIKYVVLDYPINEEEESLELPTQDNVTKFLSEYLNNIPHFSEVKKLKDMLTQLDESIYEINGQSSIQAVTEAKSLLKELGTEVEENTGSTDISKMIRAKIFEYSEEFNAGYVEFGKHLQWCYLELAKAGRLNEIDEFMNLIYGYNKVLFMTETDLTLHTVFEFLYGMSFDKYLQKIETILPDETSTTEDTEMFARYREPTEKTTSAISKPPLHEYEWGVDKRVCYDYWVAKQILDKIRAYTLTHNLTSEDEQNCMQMIENRLELVGLPDELFYVQK